MVFFLVSQWGCHINGDSSSGDSAGNGLVTIVRVETLGRNQETSGWFDQLRDLKKVDRTSKIFPIAIFFFVNKILFLQNWSTLVNPMMVCYSQTSFFWIGLNAPTWDDGIHDMFGGQWDGL